MKKKILSIVLVMMLAIVPMVVSGCGPKDEGSNTIRFWGYGDATAKEAYEAMVKAYNAGQGKTDGVEVSFSNKPESGYISLIEQSATSKTGPDVYFAWDRLFKKWTAADMTVDLTEYVNADTEAGLVDLTKIWDSTVSRFRYNKELNMSGEDEPIYGLPIDTSPTALFYNKTALTERGVCVISVAAEDMEAWNNNQIADNYGKKKSDFPALANINVPAKGFFRDDAYTRFEGETWREPASGTAMVFNDQIAMNWDEIEDIGFLMTSSKNSSNKPSTDYGYYTEWWFNYGWAVGGDCVVDMSGNGSWAYSHGDWSENYIVNEGKTYTGAITGKVYQAGETLEFLDKIECKVGDEITPDNKGGYLVNGVALGSANGGITNDSATRQDVKDKVADGTLTTLPSIREAFTRFCRLAGQNGSDLNICPYPSSFSTTSSIQYFTSGKVAMIVERGYQIAVVDEYVLDDFEWAVAPLPVYKVYAEPSEDLVSTYGDKADAYNTAVLKEGKIAGHSESTALVIRERSTKKDAAWKFIRWMIGEEAQAIKASYGFIPNQVNKVDGFYTALDPNGERNLEAFVEAAAYETPGDWWYMVDRDWIDVWASPLNSSVRNGNLTLEQYFDQYISAGNSTVRSYGNWDNGLNLVTAG